MGLHGIQHKIAWVDLTSQRVFIEQPPDEVYADYIGGYGLGAYYLYTRQRPGADPLGPENILGLLTGALTATPAIAANRFIAVAKSPKSGGWGDANCGGRFGPALKQAGLDAIFFTGAAEKPLYVVVDKAGVVLHDAGELWGQCCTATEEIFRQRYGAAAHAAVIGPAGERCSLLAAIMTDGGRAAARSGLGAVMGSKRLKGVVAIAGAEVAVAEPARLREYRKELLRDYYRTGNTSFDFFRTWGTSGGLEPNVLTGDAPVKNWAGSVEDFADPARVGGEALLPFKIKSYGCWRCPVSCGAKVRIDTGPYAGTGMRPEYETLAAFGPLCLNDNLESICAVNNLCNEYGLDTISAGTTIAFAIECFEKGIITAEDTGGLALNWGSHEAIAAVTRQMAEGQGFGAELLGDGMLKAVARIGDAAAPFAMQCGGEELALHDPRFYPGLAASYAVAPAVGHHTEYGAWFIEKNMVPPELGHPEISDKYHSAGKGEAHKYLSCYGQVVNAAGLCFFAANIAPASALPEYLTMVMGRMFSMADVLEIGERIVTLRTAFNVREGIVGSNAVRLPGRVLGRPPLSSGPTQGIKVDDEIQIRDYYAAMGWDLETGVPGREALERLGLDFCYR
ncbi:MAG: aldehyde ferredoxin oxidoreductase family protein [Deltaproteobacteria bacterium]|nr:aldehyde ferredoxin oxidoreductase family protein [Deltaproteobacteria bacterium]